MCNIILIFQKQFILNSAYDYTIISVIKWHQQIKPTSKNISGKDLSPFYLLIISFRHLLIILIRIFNHYNLIQFIQASCLRILFYAK